MNVSVGRSAFAKLHYLQLIYLLKTYSAASFLLLLFDFHLCLVGLLEPSQTVLCIDLHSEYVIRQI